MVSMASLDKRISAAIARVAADYNKKTKGEEGSRTYLTENDVVCNLYSELRKSLPSGYEAHTQIRPYYRTKGRRKVLKYISRRWEWKESENKLEGSVIDLCVLDNNPEYWNEAKGQGFRDAGGLKYWRFVSYPVDAIRAAIEVKIRVRGKIANITKDFGKIVAIESRVEPRDFAGYVVVMDSLVRPSDLERIKGKVTPSETVRIVTNKGYL